jgi:hypothetical protein
MVTNQPSAFDPRLESCFMISGNGVPAASDRDEGTRVRDDRQLRDIQDLIAKLEQVNRQLSAPSGKTRRVRTAGTTAPAGAVIPEQPGTQDRG